MKTKNNMLFAGFLWLLCSTAQATELQFSPLTQNVELGNSASVDLIITGLGDGTADSLGVFDIDVLYDISLLAFNSVVFGDQLDIFSLGSITSVDTSVSGTVNLFELSFDTVSDLNTLQASSFTLATLTFDTLATGTAALGFGAITLGDAWGSPLQPVIGDGEIVIAAVDEPQTLLLMLVPALLIFFRRII